MFFDSDGRTVSPCVLAGPYAIFKLASVRGSKMFEGVFVNTTDAETIFIPEDVVRIAVGDKRNERRHRKRLCRFESYAGTESSVVDICQIVAELDRRYGVKIELLCQRNGYLKVVPGLNIAVVFLREDSYTSRDDQGEG